MITIKNRLIQEAKDLVNEDISDSKKLNSVTTQFKNLQENWKKTGVSVYISNAEEDYIGTAYEVANHLSEQKIDVIACHGFNSINQVIPIVCDVPKRIFVEHSGYPVMPEFDLVLTSLEGNAKKQKANKTSVVKTISKDTPLCFRPSANEIMDQLNKLKKK